MKIYVDFEFNGMGGELLSMGLAFDGGWMHIRRPDSEIAAIDLDPWVAANVMPIMGEAMIAPLSEWGEYIEALCGTSPAVEFVSDWPDDIRYLMGLLITGPGTMIKIPSFRCSVVRVDAYPSTLEGAVQHNAMWDARALKHFMEVGWEKATPENMADFFAVKPVASNDPHPHNLSRPSPALPLDRLRPHRNRDAGGVGMSEFWKSALMLGVAFIAAIVAVEIVEAVFDKRPDPVAAFAALVASFAWRRAGEAKAMIADRQKLEALE